MNRAKPVSSVLPGVSRSLTTSPTPAGQTGSAFSDAAELGVRVNLIFATFQTDLGLANAFRWEFPANDEPKLKAAKAAWFRAELAQVPKVLFEMALRRIGTEHQVGRANKSLPSFGDFLALCRPKPEAVGMPSKDAAWAEALRHAVSPRHRWSHPAVLLAAKATGTHDLRTADAFQARELRQRFDRHYEQLVLQVARGEELSMPLAALGHDGSKPAHQVQQEHGERQLREQLAQQGLAGAGANAREVLLARLGIKREVVNG